MAWDENSFHKGGPILRYELNVSSQRTGGSHIFQISGNKSQVRIFLDKINEDLSPDCNDSSVTNFFDFRIRSVTFNKNDQEFSSYWSSVEVVPAYCESKCITQ